MNGVAQLKEIMASRRSSNNQKVLKLMKYKTITILLCSIALPSLANTAMEQQEWGNLKPMKEIKVLPDVSQPDQQHLNIGVEQEGIKAEMDNINQLILKKNELLSQSIEDWAKFNGIDFIWNSKKDIVIFNEIKINGKDKIQVLEKLGKQLSYQKAGFYLKFYEKNNVLVIDN